MAEWELIETAPKPDKGEDGWIIGYTSWGQHVGKLHEHVGPCQWWDDHYSFMNHDFDVFPGPTHWMRWPEPPTPSAERT